MPKIENTLKNTFLEDIPESEVWAYFNDASWCRENLGNPNPTYKEVYDILKLYVTK